MGWSADTYLDSIEAIGAEFEDSIFDAVLATAATSLLVSHLPYWDIDIIVDDKEIGRRIEFIEVDPKSDTLTGEVHEGLGFDEEDLGHVVKSLSDEGLTRSMGFPHSSAISSVGDLIDDEKSGIMFGRCVLGSGIAQSDDEFHGG